jgi:single-stranded-DNA-specific exonuclease
LKAAEPEELLAMIWKFRPWPIRSELEPLLKLGIPPLAAAICYNRGFRTPQDLDPPLTLLPLRGLEEAARRVLQALERGERIRIHGDYDADGLTGTAVLLLGLGRLGADIHAFVPHRLEEGYGVLMDRIPEHIEACDLFITVDCGISNHAELRELTENGVSVLVTDHHSPGQVHPPGILVHPMLTPELEGQPHPTGSGVAFLLLWKIYEMLGKPAPIEYADLACIGTIADVAPLRGFNRALVRRGLEQLRHSQHPGLAALAAEHCKSYSASEVAFRIAPRINAASRLGQAELALELLTTRDPLQARPLADALSLLNARRQRIEEEMLQRIWPTLDPDAPALVIEDASGHPGVMGIVASRVLEAFYKPVFIIAGGKGSVRSTPGISAVGALRFAASHLERYGGHAQAAGFAIAEGHIPAFREAIYAYASQFPPPQPLIELDGVLEGEDLEALYAALQLLEPYGEGNPEPLFLFSGKPESVRTMGEGGKHLSFRLGGLRVVKWKDNGERLPTGEIELAASLTHNDWNGERSLELRAVAYREAGQARSWIRPRPFRLALQEVLQSKAPVFVGAEGAWWFVDRGVPVVSAAQAVYWFALPAEPVRMEVDDPLSGQPMAVHQQDDPLRDGASSVHQGVRLALSEKALEALRREAQAYGLEGLAKNLIFAYQYGHPQLLADALEAWWDLTKPLTCTS